MFSPTSALGTAASRLGLAAIASAWLGAACGGSPTTPTPPAEPLKLTCPGNLSVPSPSAAAQPVTFATPTASGGKAPTSVSCTPASGSLFFPGVTTVNCTATDAAAQTAACSFTVTLSGPTLSVSKFVAFGDSVTEGQNGTFAFGFDVIDTPNAYPTKLQALFTTYYPGQGIVVTNRGVSGERIEDGNARLPGVLAQEQPGALLELHGYNNLLADCSHAVGVTPACETAIDFVLGRLREAVRIARARPSVRYVFVGTLTPPGPVSGSKDRRIAADAISRVNAGIRQMIPQEGAVVVDLYPRFLGHEAEYIASDGLHLLPAGNQALADGFYAAIQATVPQSVLPAVATPIR